MLYFHGPRAQGCFSQAERRIFRAPGPPVAVTPPKGRRQTSEALKADTYEALKADGVGLVWSNTPTARVGGFFSHIGAN